MDTRGEKGRVGALEAAPGCRGGGGGYHDLHLGLDVGAYIAESV